MLLVMRQDYGDELRNHGSEVSFISGILKLLLPPGQSLEILEGT